MKRIFYLLCIMISLYSLSAWGITKDYEVNRLQYNREKKNYDVYFVNQDGVFISDDVHYKCLEKSLKEKKKVKISYEMKNLKVTECAAL